MPYIYPVKLINLIERQAPLVAAILAALAYSFTLAPTFSHTDSGELAAVCYTFGVAHPTGYPLYTLLGGLFARLPLGSPAFNLNLMALLLTAAGVYWWGRSLDYFFGEWRTKTEDPGVVQRLRLAKVVAVFGGAFLLAFGQTWWVQGTAAEVYSLHCCLLGLNIFLVFRAWGAPDDARKPWLMLSIGLALAFSNHLSTIVILPGLAWLFFRKFGFNAAAFKLLGMMLGVFIPILIGLYAWLPIRSSMDPQYAWGNTVGWEEIWHHVSGRQFSVWFFTGMEAFKKNLADFFQRIPYEMGIGLLLALPGVVYSFKFKRDFSIFFLICIVSNLLWACNYAIKDLEPYFLLSYISMAFFSAVGLRWLWVRLETSLMIRILASAVVGVLLLVVMGVNFGKVNQRNAWQYHDYAKATLESLPPNSLVLSRFWDALISPSYYLQSVDGIRKDVQILDYHMLHDRHWYPDHIRRNLPEFSVSLGPKLDAWERTVRDFDLRGKMDVNRLSTDFDAVFNGILQQIATRPVYFSPDMKDLVISPGSGVALPKGIVLVPEQYLYRLAKIEDVQQYKSCTIGLFPLRLPANFGNPEDFALISQIRDVVRSRIRYEQQFQKPEAIAKLEGILQQLPKVEQPKP